MPSKHLPWVRFPVGARQYNILLTFLPGIQKYFPFAIKSGVSLCIICILYLKLLAFSSILLIEGSAASRVHSALRCCVYIPGCSIALWYPMYVCVMRWVSYIHVCCALINRRTKSTHAVYSSGTGTPTRLSCVKGKYASYLHHTGSSYLTTKRHQIW